MYKYLFNSKGKYVAYIYNNIYCFSKINEYIGFFKGIKLYDYTGKYIGTLTSDDRVIKKKGEVVEKITPIVKPNKPFLPYTPYNRYTMTKIPTGYEDVFIDEDAIYDYSGVDRKYNKFVGCSIYSSNKTFLGKINFNKYDLESIANKYGQYGSEYANNSVFNKYGNYGSEYSTDSPFNKYTNTPPVIVDKNGKEIAQLTVNKYVSSRIEVIDSIEFFNWFNYKCNKI